MEDYGQAPASEASLLPSGTWLFEGAMFAPRQESKHQQRQQEQQLMSVDSMRTLIPNRGPSARLVSHSASLPSRLFETGGRRGRGGFGAHVESSSSSRGVASSPARAPVPSTQSSSPTHNNGTIGAGESKISYSPSQSLSASLISRLGLDSSLILDSHGRAKPFDVDSMRKQ